jgi:hypothetical protein
LLKYLSLGFRYSSIVVWSTAKRVYAAIFRSLPIDNFDIVVCEELGVVYLSCAKFVYYREVGDILIIGIHLYLKLGP